LIDARTSIAAGATVAVMGLCGLAGCGTTVSTKKLPAHTSSADNRLHGVPFVLNRPKIAITRTPAGPGQVERFEIRIDHVPDPTQRYSLNVDPNWFSSVDFSVTLDENGSIVEVSAKTISQVAPVLTAIGKLAVAAKVTVPDLADVTGQWMTKGGRAPADKTPNACLQIARQRSPDSSPIAEVDEITGLIRAIGYELAKSKNQILKISTTRLPSNDEATATTERRNATDKEKDAAADLCRRLNDYFTPQSVRQSFFYRDIVDAAWLRTAATSRDETLIDIDAVERFVRAIDCLGEHTHSKPQPCPGAENLVILLRDGERTNDIISLESLKIREAAGRTALFASKTKFDSLPMRGDLACSRLTLNAVNKALAALPVGVRLAHDLVQMPAATWLARHDAWIAEQIERTKQADRVPRGEIDWTLDERGSAAKELASLRSERARVLGVERERLGVEELSRQIVQGGADEQKLHYLGRIAFLQRRIDDAISAAKPSGEQINPEEPVLAEVVRSSSCHTKEDHATCIKRVLGEKRPKYVVFTEVIVQ
jgi:hypothetical protein